MVFGRGRLAGGFVSVVASDCVCDDAGRWWFEGGLVSGVLGFVGDGSGDRGLVAGQVDLRVCVDGVVGERWVDPLVGLDTSLVFAREWCALGEEVGPLVPGSGWDFALVDVETGPSWYREYGEPFGLADRQFVSGGWGDVVIVEFRAPNRIRWYEVSEGCRTGRSSWVNAAAFDDDPSSVKNASRGYGASWRWFEGDGGVRANCSFSWGWSGEWERAWCTVWAPGGEAGLVGGRCDLQRDGLGRVESILVSPGVFAGWRLADERWGEVADVAEVGGVGGVGLFEGLEAGGGWAWSDPAQISVLELAPQFVLRDAQRDVTFAEHERVAAVALREALGPMIERDVERLTVGTFGDVGMGLWACGLVGPTEFWLTSDTGGSDPVPLVRAGLDKRRAERSLLVGVDGARLMFGDESVAGERGYVQFDDSGLIGAASVYAAPRWLRGLLAGEDGFRWLIDRALSSELRESKYEQPATDVARELFDELKAACPWMVFVEHEHGCALVHPSFVGSSELADALESAAPSFARSRSPR